MAEFNQYGKDAADIVPFMIYCRLASALGKSL